jgi:hypothetical protein
MKTHEYNNPEKKTCFPRVRMNAYSSFYSPIDCYLIKFSAVVIIMRALARRGSAAPAVDLSWQEVFLPYLPRFLAPDSDSDAVLEFWLQWSLITKAFRR